MRPEEYDRMAIAGKEYSGEALPPAHFVPEGRRLVMDWSSDESTTDDGWECAVTGGLATLRFGDREAEHSFIQLLKHE